MTSIGSAGDLDLLHAVYLKCRLTALRPAPAAK